MISTIMELGIKEKHKENFCSTLLRVLFTFRNDFQRTGVQYIIDGVVYF